MEQEECFITYSGWIPILTDRLIPLSSKEENEIVEYLKKPINISDDLRNPELILVDNLQFKDDYLISFQIKSQSSALLSLTINCAIGKTGIVKFCIPNQNPEQQEGKRNKEERLAIKIFKIIREIYHEHIHHSKTEAALRPVKTSYEDNALQDIIKQYDYKIIDYHDNGIKIVDKAGIERALSHIEEGLGELVYAKSFLNLHKSHFRDRTKLDERIRSLDSVSKSLEILREKLSWNLMFDSTKAVESLTTKMHILTEKIHTLTWVLVFFAVLSVTTPIGVEVYHYFTDKTESFTKDTIDELKKLNKNFEQAESKAESLKESNLTSQKK